MTVISRPRTSAVAADATSQNQRMTVTGIVLIATEEDVIMKVKELIEQLEKYEGDAEVRMDAAYYGEQDISEADTSPYGTYPVIEGE